ncbi:ParB/RepB/Spo0J family partition protein [Halomonas casei]|uniref:ParB/RepB/Spo0J family partition protein n=1 Tax=Halomonas casei TaxID=2742613 RepID=UPI003CE97E9A
MKRTQRTGQLSNLVSASASAGDNALLTLDTDRVAPRDQTREDFGDIGNLSDSIKEHGQSQPIIVRKTLPEDDVDADYIIIAGERRWRACIQAGVDVQAVLRDGDSMLTLELIENFQRKNLTPFESAKGIQSLIGEGHKKGEIARMLGVSNQFISTHAKLLKAPADVRRAYDEGMTTDSETLALLTELCRLNQEAALDLIEEGVESGISRKAVREAVKEAKDGGETAQPAVKAVKGATGPVTKQEENSPPGALVEPTEPAEQPTDSRDAGAETTKQVESHRSAPEAPTPTKIGKVKVDDATTADEVLVRVAFSLPSAPDESMLGTLLLKRSETEGSVLVLDGEKQKHDVPVELVQIVDVE